MNNATTEVRPRPKPAGYPFLTKADLVLTGDDIYGQAICEWLENNLEIETFEVNVRPGRDIQFGGEILERVIVVDLNLDEDPDQEVGLPFLVEGEKERIQFAARLHSVEAGQGLKVYRGTYQVGQA